MAATKKKTSSRGRKNSKKKSSSAGFGTEIILLIFLAVSVLLMISNFGFGGVVGNTVSNFTFGIFGLMAYFFPILLFIGIAFYIANRRNPLVRKKIIAGIFFFLFCCNLMQLLTEGYTRSFEILEYYQTSSVYRTGGGVVGGALCVSTTLAFGTAGSYVITLVVLLITLILMTQRSFFGFMEKLGSSLYQTVKGWLAQSREKREEVKGENRKTKQNTGRRSKPRSEAKNLPKEDGEGFLSGTILKNPSQETVSEEPAQMSFEIYRGDEENKKDKEETEEGADLDEEHLDFQDEPQRLSAAQNHRVRGKSGGKSKKTSAPGSSDTAGEIHEIKKEIESQENTNEKPYKFPPVSLLKKGSRGKVGDSDTHLRNTAKTLQDTLESFGIKAKVTNASCGPTVTRYELQPEQGVKLSKIVGLQDDIKMHLAAQDIRIEAPIPGKAAVGIEIPNDHNSTVMLRDLIQSDAFQKSKSKLAFAAGKDIAGQPVIADIAKMPHLLIAGATGSGKSVCINTLIMSILYKATPDEVKMIMVDPKVVELSVYNGIPHLLIPVVTDPKKAAGALNWAVAQMTERYNTFAEYNVRNLEDYNKKIQSLAKSGEEAKPMPQIIIIVDELADLMMVASGEVEDAICRLAQLARAAGIHLIIATQRPSVNVITGLIKANMPSRIAFAVSSGVDSRTILDMNGAERLLGKGDMLFYPQGYQKPARLQGAFVSDEEVSQVVEFLSEKNSKAEYSEEIEEKINLAGQQSGSTGSGQDRDVHFVEAGKFIIEKDKASIGMLQRMFKIGFNRAARIMDQLAEAGVVGPEEGTKPRKVLMSMEEFEKYIKECM